MLGHCSWKHTFIRNLPISFRMLTITCFPRLWRNVSMLICNVELLSREWNRHLLMRIQVKWTLIRRPRLWSSCIQRYPRFEIRIYGLLSLGTPIRFVLRIGIRWSRYTAFWNIKGVVLPRSLVAFEVGIVNRHLAETYHLDNSLRGTKEDDVFNGSVVKFCRSGFLSDLCHCVSISSSFGN